MSSATGNRTAGRTGASVDHLSLVAGISVDQRRRLTGRGIETLAALATVPLPATPRIDGIDAAALAPESASRRAYSSKPGNADGESAS